MAIKNQCFYPLGKSFSCLRMECFSVESTIEGGSHWVPGSIMKYINIITAPATCIDTPSVVESQPPPL